MGGVRQPRPEKHDSKTTAEASRLLQLHVKAYVAAWSSGMILASVREVPGSIPGAALLLVAENKA